MNVIQEANSHWGCIQDDNLLFNSKERLIEALENVNLELIKAKFHELFTNNPRRMNSKLYAQTHRQNTEEIKASTNLNNEYYNKLNLYTETIENPRMFNSMHQTYPYRKN